MQKGGEKLDTIGLTTVFTCGSEASDIKNTTENFNIV